MRTFSIAGLLLAATAIQSGCQAQKGESTSVASGGPSATASTPAPTPAASQTSELQLVMPAPSAPVPVSHDEQAAFIDKSARTAWAFVLDNYQPQTGMIRTHETYAFGTVWDITSALAAYHSAHALGYLDDATYRRYMDRILQTLATMPLYDGVAYNKLYSNTTGAMVDRDTHASKTGYGWSVLDIGRLLTWLRIVANNDPAAAPEAQKIVNRLDMKRLIANGYLQGEDLDPSTGKSRQYQEGRIGYEQYAAAGFEQWGARADKALDFAANGEVVKLNGQTILADKRGGDLLTSEPFVMMGIELGWSGPYWKPLALSVLAAQEARYRQTGKVTMVSEDAIPQPPAYFYYYLLYHDGKSFVVTSPGGAPNDSYPRWVSAKAAFGYHALAPSAYTWRALKEVQWGSAPGRGWTSGVFEGTHNSTRSFNLNTAAVVLESALYFKRGCPLVEANCGR